MALELQVIFCTIHGSVVYVLMIAFLLRFLECMDLSGQNRRPIVSLNATEMPYGLTLTDGNVFWTDWKR